MRAHVLVTVASCIVLGAAAGLGVLIFYKLFAQSFAGLGG